MAKKSLIVSCNKKQRDHDDAIASGKKPKRPTQVYNRCKLCGRPHGYLGIFKICRICFRKYASEGMIPGVTKSSW